jgi:hypothetical protein
MSLVEEGEDFVGAEPNGVAPGAGAPTSVSLLPVSGSAIQRLLEQPRYA